MNNTIISAQIGLSFVLLVAAGLVLKSFRNLLHIDLGFEPVGVTTLTMPLPMQRYNPTNAAGKQPNVDVTSAIVERVHDLPGVQDAGAMFPAIYANDVNTDGFLVEGRSPPAGSSFETQTVQIAMTPGLLSTLKMRLLYGRDVTSGDRLTTVPVVIIDDELARRYWNGHDALGKRLRMTGDTTWRTIVGVVASIRDENVARPTRPHTFFPYAQYPGTRPTLAVRMRSDRPAATEAIRRAIAQLDPSVAATNIRPLSDAIGQTLDSRRLTEVLLGGFATLALILAGIGLYGVVALYVANRHREFGIRLAIGAAPTHLLLLVLREGVGLASIGLALGIGAATVTTRWIRTLLFDVQPNDPVVYGTPAATLLAVALVACYVPARRAAKSDPLQALRAE